MVGRGVIRFRQRFHTHPRLIGVYHRFVRRINIHLDDELDAELAAEAARLGESKAELIRRAAREWLDRRTGDPGDAWAEFTGAVTGAPYDDDRSDDEVIYGI
jgi:Arc/MetJ family transcription regulator